MADVESGSVSQGLIKDDKKLAAVGDGSSVGVLRVDVGG